MVSLLLFGSSVQALSVDIGLNFTAATYLVDSWLIPPDTMGAVGEEHVVQLINGLYTVHRKSDGARVDTKIVNQFWLDAGVVPRSLNWFDPRIVYDAASGRWFAAAVDGDHPEANNFLIAVSHTSDPTDGWTGFQIDSDSTDQRWADFPMLGVNQDGVYLSANMFPLETGFHAIAIVAVPKADLLAPIPTVANATVFENLPLHSWEWTTQPVFDLDGSGLAAAFLGGAGDHITRSDLLGSIYSPTLDPASATIPISWHPLSPHAEQPGPKQNLDTFWGGFSSHPILQNGAFWVVDNVEVNGRAAIRWVQIDASTNIVLQEGILADDELDLFYPSIAVNEFDQVVIGFSGSSELQFVSTYAAVGATADGTTTFGELLLLKEGTASYELLDGDRNRWGDYSATVVDPTDPRVFWTFQEFVSSTDRWSTQITQLFLVTEPSACVLVALGLAGSVIRRRRTASGVPSRRG